MIASPGFKRMDNTVLLATQGSGDRVEHIDMQVDRWNGPVFASVFVRPSSRHGDHENLAMLLRRGASRNLYLTVVYAKSDSCEYPINFMRNVVMSSIELEYQGLSPQVLLVDADALPSQSFDCTGMSQHSLLVVPAFDLATGEAASTKSELALLLQANKADIMHAAHAPSYSIGLIGEWIATQATVLPFEYEIYKEPYIIAHLQVYLDHLFDERFMGRGYNKQAFHFELWASQRYQYWLLSSSFIVNLHNPIPVLPTTLHARQIWRNFRDEVANRYGLVCRESFWRLCDDRGIHCGEICRLSNQEPLQPARVVALPSVTQSQITAFTIQREECIRQVDVVLGRNWTPELVEFSIRSILLYANWTRRIIVPHSIPNHDPFACVLYLPAGAFPLQPLQVEEFWPADALAPHSHLGVGRLGVFDFQLLLPQEDNGV
ncbi:hypothetical protein BASA81_002020 [Batrachochytrium salamandrivorans]|nr:hypothetical protein BASA81_002020 [Batrachochytrium salamandrivorans]